MTIEINDRNLKIWSTIGPRATFGTSDAGITLDGPIGKNTTFIASVRQSYLQFLFKLIKLPFLPLSQGLIKIPSHH